MLTGVGVGPILLTPLSMWTRVPPEWVNTVGPGSVRYSAECPASRNRDTVSAELVLAVLPTYRAELESTCAAPRNGCILAVNRIARP